MGSWRPLSLSPRAPTERSVCRASVPRHKELCISTTVGCRVSPGALEPGPAGPAFVHKPMTSALLAGRGGGPTAGAHRVRPGRASSPASAMVLDGEVQHPRTHHLTPQRVSCRRCFVVVFEPCVFQTGGPAGNPAATRPVLSPTKGGGGCLVSSSSHVVLARGHHGRCGALPL